MIDRAGDSANRSQSSRLMRLVTITGAILGITIVSCAVAPDQALPSEPFETLDNASMRLDNGELPRVLNLWATWCAPCRAELPMIDEVADLVKADIEIIGVNTGDRSNDAQELVDELGLSFTQVLDPDALVQAALKVTGMPATVFVDQFGGVIYVHSGEVDRDELLDLLATHHGYGR